jgi:phosphoribosylaminoimidazole-succinocarboxamide synthase
VKTHDILIQGKAKTVFYTDVPGELLVRFRDDITAFDGKKKDVLEGKGRYNIAVSAFFFRYLEERGIPTHFIRLVDDNSMLVRELDMIPIEVIVRNIAAGSIVRNYPFEEGAAFDPPLIVMDLKDDRRHDPMVNDDIITALGLVTADEIRQIRKKALAVNEGISSYFAEKGIILVDFKLEFGHLGSEIVLGDEISMDSMRLWDATTKESLDKDVYRFDKGDVLSAYARVAKRILPEHFGGI